MRKTSLSYIGAMPVSHQGEESLAGAEEAGQGSLLVRTRKLQHRLNNPATSTVHGQMSEVGQDNVEKRLKVGGGEDSDQLLDHV